MDENNNGVNYGADTPNDGVNYGPDPVNPGNTTQDNTTSTSYGSTGASYGSTGENYQNPNQGAPEYQNVNANPNYATEANDPINIAALVCGIVSIVGLCLSFVPFWASLGCGIAGIILGVKGKLRAGAKLGKAGLICGIVGIVLHVLALLLLLIFGIAAIGLSSGMAG